MSLYDLLFRAWEAVVDTVEKIQGNRDADAQNYADYTSENASLKRELAQAKRDGETLAKELNEVYAAGGALAEACRAFNAARKDEK